MIKCMIVDDETLGISVMKKMIGQYCPRLEVIATATDMVQAQEIIAGLKPQLVFLDVEMNDGDAFELMENLMPLNFEVILVTAYDHYAIKGFKYGVLDYLLKPVAIDDLKQSVERAIRRIGERNLNQQLSEVIPHLKTQKTLGRIALREKDSLTLFDVDEIMYCIAEGAYTQFFFRDGKALLVSGNLKEFEGQLPKENFCRIHDSGLVNLQFVKKYFHGRGGYVEMIDGKTIEVSARKKTEFLARLKS